MNRTELFQVVVLICRKQLCGPGETIQSYNHQTYHKPQLIQKLSNSHHLNNAAHDDDIDVGKVGDEVIKLEGKSFANIRQNLNVFMTAMELAAWSSLNSMLKVSKCWLI